MSTIRVVNLQHTDATVPNIVLESDGTSVFASGITISGATTLTVSGTAEFASGTAAAPKITFIDDNDTGIYSPAANNLGITTNGTAALTIDASQRVGISTTSPGQALDVVGDAQIGPTSGTALLYLGTRGFSSSLKYNASTGNLDIAPRGGYGITFKSNTAGTTEWMRIDSSGNVGVGTTSPSTGISGSAQGLSVAHSNVAFLSIENTAASGKRYTLYANDSGSLVTYDEDANTERMRIDNAGRVGIGTTSPGSFQSNANQLVVQNNSGAAGITIDSFSGGSSNIHFADGETGNESYRGIIQYTHSDDAFRFSTAASERMRILSGGGITFNGDTAAANALDDYEEGTWTPVIKSGTNTITYSGGQQRFYYQKIGNHVTVTFSLNAATTSGTTGGGFTIEGLPFGSANISQLRTIGTHVIYYNTGLRATGWPNFVHLSSNTSTMEVYTKTSSAGAYDRANVDQVGSGSYFFWQLTYQTA